VGHSRHPPFSVKLISEGPHTPSDNYRRPKTTLNKNPEKGCDDTTTVSVITRQLEQMKLNEDQEIPRNPKGNPAWRKSLPKNRKTDSVREYHDWYGKAKKSG
jgi:hypothetical protein